MIFDERDDDAWAWAIWFDDHLLALEFLLKIVDLKGHMRLGLDELRIRRIRFVPHPLDVVGTFFVTTHINFQVLQMHFALSFFGGRNSEMMVLPHFEHSSEGLLKTPNDPSSATRPARALDCNLDARAGFAAAHG